MYTFFRYDGGKLPLRALAIVLAEEWHVPPWEIWERKGIFPWLQWRNVVKREQARANRMKAKT